MRTLVFVSLLAFPMSSVAEPVVAATPEKSVEVVKTKATAKAESTLPRLASKPAPKAEEKPAASKMDVNKDGIVDAGETKAEIEAEAGVKDIVAEGKEVAKAVKDLKKADKSQPIGPMILVLLGAVFKLLLSMVKVAAKNAPWFSTKDGKRVVKYSTLGLGALAALTANLGFGMPWLSAMQLMLAGPLAVAIHEYTKDSKESAPVKEG